MPHEIKVIRPEKVSIKDDPTLSEAWLREVIATDPPTANWVWGRNSAKNFNQGRGINLC